MTNNKSNVSHGGQHIREMIKEKDYVVLYNMAVGGPWTWVQQGKDSVMSCLDIAIIARNLFQYVKSVVIDKERALHQKGLYEKTVV